MIYLYAISEPSGAPPACPGLEDAEVRLAPAGEVEALYSSHDRLEGGPQPEALWRHEQVVEAAMEAGPTLPVRFGTTFADLEALLASLECEASRLWRQLQRVRGCVELAVRVGVLDGGEDETVAHTGRAYVEAKLARRQRRRAIFDDTLGPLGEVARRALDSESSSDRELVCASYLVEADQVDRFTERVTLVAERNPDLWLSCTGPWPPYSFAGIEAAA